MKKLKAVTNNYWWLVLIAILVLATFVRFLFLNKASIWHDEGFSAMLAFRNPLEIWAGSARDVHPPLFYEKLHFWSLFFGKSAISLRSFSAVCGVIIVFLGFLFTKKISTTKTALLATLLLAINPFLIRYSQEARMYGILGVFMMSAMIAVVGIVQHPKKTWPYILYTLSIAAGLYTHYFTALVVISFWLYFLLLLIFSKNKATKYFISLRWWLANLAALVLFLPWVPNLIAQFTRGQGLSWLPVASTKTFHDAMWQFFTFTDAHKILQLIYWAGPLLLIVATLFVIYKDKSKQHFSWLLTLYSFLPILLAIAVSLRRPIFHERYFAFATIGICIIIALAINEVYQKTKWLYIVLACFVILVELFGVRNVYAQANHRMDTVMDNLDKQFRNGDVIVAGELYVYFDGSFYNKTGKEFLLYTGQGRPNGYGESGLIYDKNIYLDSYNSIESGRVWLLGKTGDHQYYESVPKNWNKIFENSAGYSEVRLYQIQ